jgi:hypothetical protein
VLGAGLDLVVEVEVALEEVDFGEVGLAVLEVVLVAVPVAGLAVEWLPE